MDVGARSMGVACGGVACGGRGSIRGASGGRALRSADPIEDGSLKWAGPSRAGPIEAGEKPTEGVACGLGSGVGGAW